MLIVWFGESPSLFRDHVYVNVHYDEAPGVSEGVPVRKSGIRVGEVTAIKFDDRPNQPDGVLVTLSLERRFVIKAGSVPQLTRSLMGDVTVDFLPGSGPGKLPTGNTPGDAPIIEGGVSPDPSKALAAATEAFQKAGTTLASIDMAAKGISDLSKSSDRLNEFLTTWVGTGKKVSTAAASIDRVLSTNEKDVQPAITNLREVSEKLNTALDQSTVTSFKAGLDRFSTSFARFDSALASAGPLFRDLGAAANTPPTTDFGQAVRRMNMITADVNLLTRQLSDGRGRLNPDGSLQKLVMRSDLYDNFNQVAVKASESFAHLRPILVSFRIFAEKVAKDPGSISRGALQR
jgi:phospholipid/cholesterol/gamma-HCH transport system substrate-binding protein